jgi:hypothetical protein
MTPLKNTLNRFFATLFVCLFIATAVQAQDHFETKAKSFGMFAFAGQIAKGHLEFDHTTYADRTWILPNYDAKSLSSDAVVGKQYDALRLDEAKAGLHKKNYEAAFMASTLKSYKHKFSTTRYKKMSKEEIQTALFFSFHNMGDFRYVVVWFVNDKEEELPLSLLFLNDLDLGTVQDLRMVFNFLDQGFAGSKDEMDRTALADLYDQTADDTRPDLEIMKALSGPEAQAQYQESQRVLVGNYLLAAEHSTLLIPEEEKNHKMDLAMSKWSLSAIEYASQSKIDELRASNDPGYSFLHVQSEGEKVRAISMYYIIGAANDKILYVMQLQGEPEKPFLVLGKLNTTIAGQRGLLDPESTILYGKVEFKAFEFPADLATEKVQYVNLTRDQYAFAGWLNKSFERKMKKYPFEFHITDKLKDNKGCKYRILMKPSIVQFMVEKPGRYDHNTGHTGPSETKLVTKELFVVFLQDIKTGENYEFQGTGRYYMHAFKVFVDEAKGLVTE